MQTVCAVLRAMMQHAFDADPEVIPVNPCTRINLPTGPGGTPAELKTKVSARTVPAADWVLNEIGTHISRYDTGPDGLIFISSHGKMLARNSFNHH